MHHRVGNRIPDLDDVIPDTRGQRRFAVQPHKAEQRVIDQVIVDKPDVAQLQHFLRDGVFPRAGRAQQVDNGTLDLKFRKRG